MSERELCVYSDSIKRAIESIPQDLLDMSERALMHKVNPSLKGWTLKTAFWDEFTYASNNKRVMRPNKVYGSAYSKTYFYNHILKNPALMAWIISPLVEYEDKTKAALNKVTGRYEELIAMDITTTRRIKDEEADNGYRVVTETDPKKALVLLQVIKNLEDRVKGSAVQRQVSVHTDTPSRPGDSSVSLDMGAVNSRLKELEGKLNPYEEREDDTQAIPSKERDDSSDGVLEATARHINVESDGAGDRDKL